jgi:hypothetical protein
VLLGRRAAPESLLRFRVAFLYVNRRPVFTQVDLLSPPPDDYLFQNNQMESVFMSECAVGPAVGREWVEHGR